MRPHWRTLQQLRRLPRSGDTSDEPRIDDVEEQYWNLVIVIPETMAAIVRNPPLGLLDQQPTRRRNQSMEAAAAGERLSREQQVKRGSGLTSLVLNRTMGKAAVLVYRCYRVTLPLIVAHDTAD